jgi:hypothetical protein
MEKIDDEFLDKLFSICSLLGPSYLQALRQLQKKAPESIMFCEDRPIVQQSNDR